jgi:hypothetical protein
MRRVDQQRSRGVRCLHALSWALGPLLLVAAFGLHPGGQGKHPPGGAETVFVDAVHADAAPHLETSRQRPGHHCPACLHQLHAGAAVLTATPDVVPLAAGVSDPAPGEFAAAPAAHGAASPRGPPAIA